MKTPRTVLFYLACLTALGRPALGQATATAALAAAQAPYHQAFANQSQLINGREYVDYAKRYHASIGHQFFLSPELKPGTADYNGHHFSNLQLTYDVVLDQVVMQQPTSPQLLRLINEHVRGFSIGEHRFVRLVADSVSGKVIRTGFYEVLVDSGAVQLLAQRAKRRQEQTAQFVDLEFTPTDRLFIRKGGRYYPVASKAAVVRLLADHGKEVQQYIQAHKLKFRKARRETDTVQLVAYYAGLPPL